MNKKAYFAAFLLGWASLMAHATVTVTNLVVVQHPGTKLMEVTYDVHSTDANTVSISLVVSNGAEQVSAPSVTGDVGDDVEIGSSRSMIWNAGADWNGNVAVLDYMIVADDGVNLVVPSGMVLIPGGTNEGVDPEYGAYSLTVRSFCMDETEVTQNFWDYVYNWAIENSYDFEYAGAGKDSDHPVQTINWYDCAKWCNARSQMEGRTPCYSDGGGDFYREGYNYQGCNTNANGYRLPTPEEWEYAARGGLTSQRFPWGNIISWTNANYASINDETIPYDLSCMTGLSDFHPDYEVGDLPYTSPVRSFAPNGYGLYDMIGNVSEWCGLIINQDRIAGGSWGSRTTTYYSRYPFAADEARNHIIGSLSSGLSSDNKVGFRAVCR